MMPFYRDHVYPRLVTWLGNPKPIDDIRRRILPLAKGDVLEIGVGPGVNFNLYDPGQVKKLYALEPNPGMLGRAQGEARRSKLNVEFIDLPGERLPLSPGSIDTVVSTFTLCTIPAVTDAIQGIGRVLKPDGRFIFFEHGQAPDLNVRHWQRRCEPLFRWAFEGCHVTRDIPSLISNGGLKIALMEQRYLAPFPKSGSYCWWGVAIPEL
jgi:SAM-dependent methyltransferase